LLVCIDMFFFLTEHRVNSVDVQRNKILTVHLIAVVEEYATYVSTSLVSRVAEI
jgi:hypothetical protein